MAAERNYNYELDDSTNSESEKYAYSFDFDVMHPFMVKSFRPFFNKGSLLELGSYKGDFTARLLPYFNDVTCVEASDVAIAEAKNKLGEKVKFVNSLFEKAALPKRYDNIVLTHVLEHLDDPVLILKRINNEWLAEGGGFFSCAPMPMLPPADRRQDGIDLAQHGGHTGRSRAWPPLHLHIGYIGKRCRCGGTEGSSPFRDILQGVGKLPMGSIATNGYHLQRVLGGLL